MTLLGAPATRCLLNTQFYHCPTRRLFASSSSILSKHRSKQRIPDEPKDKWNYNTSPFDGKISDDHHHLRLVNANILEKETTPPHGVKMLVRDFIEDSLYNPNYGYFPKQATIFNTQDATFDFTNFRDSAEFQEEVGAKYAAYGADKFDGPGRQLWHTPTELFKPWYGRAVGRCLVSEYLLKYFPYEDFVIYEIGAGNGTLAMDILNLLQEDYPDVYERTRYNIIEISESLVKLQKKKLQEAHPCVNITHKSIFHWETTEPAPCFFVAMEVIDNFAHDIVRYDLSTLQPYQGLVTIDKNGDFDTVYTPVTDPLVASFLHARRTLSHPPPINRLLKYLHKMPFAPNLSTTEYVPTRLLSLLRTLRNYFPRHRLLLSDFSSLPDTISGVNSPVVQTRFQNITVPCTTLLVKQGYFDIFFPTDFERLRDIGLPIGERKSSVFSHSQFLETYAELEKTRLRNGENPMLDFYKNVKFLF
ncbi:S-adenosyl-L-methionine-dependent methyltransferase [Flammula alnicola]|nr:S-adenosyl-L-methionine-dependent methyltransferase [Flammula alnicola]